MNMQSTITLDHAHAESIGCVHDLLIAALETIDDLELPSDIGAHLDLAIHKLSKLCPDHSDAALETLPA